MDLQAPTRDNVELGDLLISEGFKGGIRIFPIIAREENLIIARSDSGSPSSSPYGLAVVLKKDGTYLVGDEYIKVLLDAESTSGPNEEDRAYMQDMHARIPPGQASTL